MEAGEGGRENAGNVIRTVDVVAPWGSRRSVYKTDGARHGRMRERPSSPARGLGHGPRHALDAVLAVQPQRLGCRNVESSPSRKALCRAASPGLKRPSRSSTGTAQYLVRPRNDDGLMGAEYGRRRELTRAATGRRALADDDGTDTEYGEYYESSRATPYCNQYAKTNMCNFHRPSAPRLCRATSGVYCGSRERCCSRSILEANPTVRCAPPRPNLGRQPLKAGAYALPDAGRVAAIPF